MTMTSSSGAEFLVNCWETKDWAAYCRGRQQSFTVGQVQGCESWEASHCIEGDTSTAGQLQLLKLDKPRCCL